MERDFDSLYKICLNKTCRLLLENYWRTDMSPNPFLAFTPEVVQDLIELVCRQTRGPIKSSSLRLLLASGRVAHFKLQDVELESNDAEEIFQTLQVSGEILKSIKIKNVLLGGFSDTSPNLGLLIRSSKSLVSVETCINFVLSEIYYCDSLQELILNYLIRDRLKSFYEVRRKSRYNNSLTVLKISRPQENPNLHREIADILQHCLELVEIDYDVAGSLKYLHKKNGSAKYKLRKTILGSGGDSYAEHATKEAVIIASSTCPDLRVVEVTPDDYRSINALRNFKHITILTLNKPSWFDNDYRYGIRPLLEVPHFGHNLKSLTLRQFSEIDFASIGACCLNIEYLKVEYSSEGECSDLSPNSFRKLTNLDLVNLNSEPCNAFTLRTILFNASALAILKIRKASMLTDVVLDEILENDSVFSKLKYLEIRDCGFTINGLKKLARRLRFVRRVVINSRTIKAEDAERVLKNLESAKLK